MQPVTVWTVAEANAALDDVRDLLAEARDALAAMRDAAAHAEDLRIVYGAEVMQEDHAAHREWQRHDTRRRVEQARLQGVQARFTERGMELKDVDLGLVDFFAVHGGERVYLCWKDGEPEVQAWHPLDAGFAGRQPLPPDLAQP